MLTTNLVSPLFFVMSLLVMFLLVPQQKIRQFLNLGIIGGLGVALVLLYIMQNTFGFWNFKDIDISHIIGIPFFLSATWSPVIIIFAYLLSRLESLISIAVIIFSFPVGATLLHYSFIKYELLSYSDWNLFYTFLVSLGIHLTITSYLYKTSLSNRLNI